MLSFYNARKHELIVNKVINSCKRAKYVQSFSPVYQALNESFYKIEVDK